MFYLSFSHSFSPSHPLLDMTHNLGYCFTMLRIVLRALSILKKIFTINTYQIPEDAVLLAEFIFSYFILNLCLCVVSYAINVLVPSEPTKNIKYPKIVVTFG